MNKLNELLNVFSSSLTTSSESENFGEWAKKYVISNESSLSSGYDISLRPFFREIADAYLNRSEIKLISICSATGSGKSAFMTSLLNHIIVNNPAPTIFASNNETETGIFLESRLLPTFKNNPLMKNLLPSKTGLRKQSINFPSMGFWCVSANNKASLQSKSVRYIFADEVWLYKKSVIKELLARHHNRWNKKGLFVSQASWKNDDDEWWNFHNSSKQYDWGFQCVNCGKDIALKLHLFKWDNDKNLTLEERAETCFLECPHCKKRYEDDVITRRKISDEGKFIATSEKKLGEHIGYNINAFALFDIPWKETILEFLKANRIKKQTQNSEPLHQFFQKRLAQFVGDEQLQEKGIEYVLDDSISISGFKVSNEVSRFIALDAQRSSSGEYFWGLCASVCDEGKIRVQDYGRLENEKEVQEFVEKCHVESCDVFVDGADNLDFVQSFALRNGFTLFNATSAIAYQINGVNSLFSEPFYQIVNGTSEQVMQINFSSQGAKKYLHFLSTQKRIIFPYDVSKVFIEQIESQCLRYVDDRRAGRKIWKFQEVKKGWNNSHYLDCIVAITVMMEMYGLLTVEEPLEEEN